MSVSSGCTSKSRGVGSKLKVEVHKFRRETQEYFWALTSFARPHFGPGGTQTYVYLHAVRIVCSFVFFTSDRKIKHILFFIGVLSCTCTLRKMLRLSELAVVISQVTTAL